MEEFIQICLFVYKQHGVEPNMEFIASMLLSHGVMVKSIFTKESLQKIVEDYDNAYFNSRDVYIFSLALEAAREVLKDNVKEIRIGIN